MNSDSSHSRPQPHPSELKNFDILFTVPADLVEDPGTGKSLNFHRFMRHARQCHQNVLEFLMRRDLHAGVGDCLLVANERKTVISCTATVAGQLRSLPFVESVAANNLPAQNRQQE